MRRELSESVSEFKRRAKGLLSQPSKVRWFFEPAGAGERLPPEELSQWLFELCWARWAETGEREEALALAARLMDLGADAGWRERWEGERDDAETRTAFLFGRRRSPLMGASARGELEMMELLASRGARADEQNGAGENPLGFACGAPEALRACEWLLRAGADPTGDAEAAGRGMALPPLLIAVRLRSVALAELFLAWGASEKDGGEGRSVEAIERETGQEGFVRAVQERLELSGSRQEGLGLRPPGAGRL